MVGRGGNDQCELDRDERDESGEEGEQEDPADENELGHPRSFGLTAAGLEASYEWNSARRSASSSSSARTPFGSRPNGSTFTLPFS